MIVISKLKLVLQFNDVEDIFNGFKVILSVYMPFYFAVKNELQLFF